MERRVPSRNFADKNFEDPKIMDEFYYTSGKKEAKKISLKDFEFIEFISEGAYAKVYETIRKKYRIRYAIKCLDNKQIQNSLILKQPFIERKVLLTTNHENIIKMYHCFGVKSKFYFILEYAGYTLSKFYEIPKNFFKIKKHLRQIINALEYFRSLKIVHRDIKPKNILVDSKEDIKVIDFGSAKFLDTGHNAGCEQKTKGDRHTYTGTIAYMSPEVIDEKESNTTAADLWGLGCTLYRIFVGERPFEGENEEVIKKDIKKCNPSYPDYLPKELVDLVKGLIVLDPTKRLGYKSFDEIRSHAFFKMSNERLEEFIQHKHTISQDKGTKQSKKPKDKS